MQTYARRLGLLLGLCLTLAVCFVPVPAGAHAYMNSGTDGQGILEVYADSGGDVTVTGPVLLGTTTDHTALLSETNTGFVSAGGNIRILYGGSVKKSGAWSLSTNPQGGWAYGAWQLYHEDVRGTSQFTKTARTTADPNYSFQVDDDHTVTVN